MCIKQHSPLRLQKRVLLGLSILFYVALTNFAHRNPPGMNFVHAACDLLLLGLSIPFYVALTTSPFTIRLA